MLEVDPVAHLEELAVVHREAEGLGVCVIERLPVPEREGLTVVLRLTEGEVDREGVLVLDVLRDIVEEPEGDADGHRDCELVVVREGAEVGVSGAGVTCSRRPTDCHCCCCCC